MNTENKIVVVAIIVLLAIKCFAVDPQKDPRFSDNYTIPTNRVQSIKLPPDYKKTTSEIDGRTFTLPYKLDDKVPAEAEVIPPISIELPPYASVEPIPEFKPIGTVVPIGDTSIKSVSPTAVLKISEITSLISSEKMNIVDLSKLISSGEIGFSSIESLITNGVLTLPILGQLISSGSIDVSTLSKLVEGGNISVATLGKLVEGGNISVATLGKLIDIGSIDVSTLTKLINLNTLTSEFLKSIVSKVNILISSNTKLQTIENYMILISIKKLITPETFKHPSITALDINSLKQTDHIVWYEQNWDHYVPSHLSQELANIKNAYMNKKWDSTWEERHKKWINDLSIALKRRELLYKPDE